MDETAYVQVILILTTGSPGQRAASSLISPKPPLTLLQLGDNRSLLLTDQPSPCPGPSLLKLQWMRRSPLAALLSVAVGATQTASAAGGPASSIVPMPPRLWW